MRASQLLLTGALLASACGRDEAPSPPSVVLVVADTLRADRMGFQAGGVDLTPNLDAFAANAVRFAAASSHAPWTLPSIASLFTSLHPLEHGAGGRVPDFTRLAPDAVTLTDALDAEGYASHAIANVTFLDPEAFGVTAGFDSVDVAAFESNRDVRAATATTDLALAWIDRHRERSGDAPFFLLVHYFDPHAVYAPPREYRERWAAPEDRATDWTFGTREQMVALRRGAFEPSRRDISRASRLYDGEVAFLDSELGRLFAGLDERIPTERSIVVVTADHGEEFLEHDGFEHGHTLYEELLHVPLIVRAPALEPAVVDARVRHVDVAPTVLALLELEPPPSFVGRSLLPWARGVEVGDLPVLAHGNFWGPPLSSLTIDGWKLIVLADGTKRLYDLASDPREELDRAAAEPERVGAMTERLGAAEEAMRQLVSGGPASLTPEQRADLSGLGYGR